MPTTTETKWRCFTCRWVVSQKTQPVSCVHCGDSTDPGPDPNRPNADYDPENGFEKAG